MSSTGLADRAAEGGDARECPQPPLHSRTSAHLDVPVSTVQVSEERLIELLEQVNQQAGAGKTRVTIQRRRTVLDDDDF